MRLFLDVNVLLDVLLARQPILLYYPRSSNQRRDKESI